jgi:polysaccharide pyruvyl transferase WcaK-like protein
MINLFCIRPKGFNVGNDAIYLGLQHFLYGAFGEVVNLISLPATAKYESHATAGLTAKTIYEINQYGHGVIVGGGNLYENGELTVDLEALDSLEVPLMLFSLSRGRVYNRQCQLVDRTDALPDRVLRALDRQASVALFRDTATGEYLQQLGCQHHAVGGCPTIFLERMAHRLPEIPATGSRTALVSVRHPSLMSIPLRRQSHVYGDVLAIVEQLVAGGYDDVRLLCHDHRDLSFAASFPDLEYVYTGDVFTYLAMLRQCSLSVGYRLHAFLPCQAFGVPAINISYDERAASLVETVGLGEWNINMIRQPDVAAQVADRLARLDDLSAIRSHIQPRWNALYQSLAGGFAEFARCVRESGDIAHSSITSRQMKAAA